MAIAYPSSRTETSSYSHSYSSAFASSSVASFAPRASPLMMSSSSSSAAKVKLHGHRTTPPSPPSPSSTVRFSVEQRPESPGRRSITVKKDTRNSNAVPSSSEKRTRKCMCSPTTHAGSFRCAYHKRMAEQEQQRREKQQQKQQQVQQQQQQQVHQQTAWSRSRKLNLRRSAMKNSLVRIGVEGEIVKRTLTTLIRPSSHELRRREAFQPKPSRLSIMSKAQD
ncbi:uncharacterized protein [Cicer arietinum]|uniref:Probable serine/threonine-protein kinase fhkB n=1 Tax=Cicer arietinum TaxID=3827 RepID=A0A1S2XB63_CICAR|nr:probable serine/threonine-protein kinase fhkB [Cicer arietinum]